MALISWHSSTAVYFLFIGIFCKNTILDGDYSVFVSLVYYLVLIWLVYKYSNSYEPTKVPETDFSVCIVGAGFSGINMAVKLKQIGVKFRIIEKDRHLGGTWWMNQYPGCGCDLPSHMYSLSYELNSDWTQLYPSQAEILQYMERVTDKYGIRNQIELQKRVTKMKWDEKDKKWIIALSDGEVFTANAVVCGVGLLNIPKVPEFKGQELFQGQAFHYSGCEQWRNWAPEGKRVAVIGTGSGASQIIPSIAPQVQHLYVFQRTPGWVFPKPSPAYPGWVKWLFRIYPPIMWLQRIFLYSLGEILFQTIWKTDGLLQMTAQRLLAWRVRSTVKKPDVAEKLIPDYHVGCKRIVPSSDYLSTFNRDNVTLVTERIERLSQDGIVTVDGSSYQVDMIIYATGFHPDKSFQTFETVGLNKHMDATNKSTENGRITLQEEWTDTPNAYLGISYPGYPNLFYLLGPGTALGHSTVVFMSECSADYTVEAIRYMIEKNVRSLDIKPEVHEEYQKWAQDTLKDKSFNAASCTSWYRNKEGVNYTLWPTHLLSYWFKTHTIDFDNYFKEK